MSNNLVVFPNPNVGEFGISFNAHSRANENVNVIIYDISGRCVYENSFLNN
ncbi:T9SS type A sorting domain-containing protein [Gelidibacter japonicus]|uniref:T9SS type A sorting domain-containing protein n=1 Tax=Gelidibacter japonicus TaxID=1962232 RepID=UPI002021303E|nr:T9SS type A sorting domain-containing protein [Gelidibacter japonicus]MCL8008970.1 T9SS type A sorting domain-containing protein [Gelidibacter japonicus]